MVQEWPTGDAQWIPWVVGKEKGYYRIQALILTFRCPRTRRQQCSTLAQGDPTSHSPGTIDVVSAVGQDAPVTSIARYGNINNGGVLL